MLLGSIPVNWFDFSHLSAIIISSLHTLRGVQTRCVWRSARTRRSVR